MGRYLDGWEDAQTRGSSRNGGRGGESINTDSSYTAEDISKSACLIFIFQCGNSGISYATFNTSTDNTAITLKMVHMDPKASQVTA